MSEKVIDYKIEDGKLKVTADPNKDGEPVITIELDLSEVIDEITKSGAQ